jgi:hypothetical protein
MNVEIGAEVAQFPEKEYIKRNAFAVYKNSWYTTEHCNKHEAVLEILEALHFLTTQEHKYADSLVGSSF